MPLGQTFYFKPEIGLCRNKKSKPFHRKPLKKFSGYVLWLINEQFFIRKIFQKIANHDFLRRKWRINFFRFRVEFLPRWIIIQNDIQSIITSNKQAGIEWVLIKKFSGVASEYRTFSTKFWPFLRVSIQWNYTKKF